MVSSLRNEFESNESSKLIEVNRQLSQRIPRSEREPVYSSRYTYLFDVFRELNAARTSNGFGYNPFSYTELDAYQRLTNISLTAWEVRLLKQMDVIYLTAVGKSQEIKSKAVSK
jgi:hypothetical protein